MALSVLMLATLASASSSAKRDPQVQLECGVVLKGSHLHFNNTDIDAFQGISYVQKTPERFTPAEEIEEFVCESNGLPRLLDATTPGSICAQAATPGLNLAPTLMNAMLIPYAIYVLPLLVALCGVSLATKWQLKNLPKLLEKLYKNFSRLRTHIGKKNALISDVLCPEMKVLFVKF
jgi:hypothetical protein